ncbi:Spo0B domain-containing protein [Lentibacillus sp. Marseille-P4043]|uniref:Spo0B domain-containing protein n=1 Tax=Lentibacillus sp. Marseille-P4043 TaxID=2040293 RepID=UPI00131A5D18|nr:Spo0B domain-containing protein [Lentibacillus sp. Marseille-P4043]
MDEKAMVDLLRLYRHDLMNDLQIVQGYASMGKIDRVQTKVTECMDRFHEERKLMSLSAAKFALWLIQFNSIHANIRLSYYINVENKTLSGIDNTLLNQCQLAIKSLEQLLDDEELYDGKMVLGHTSSAIEINLSLTGNFQAQTILELNEKYMDKMNFCKAENGVTCHVSIPFY